jgi:deazaflavin-dependent oxidoreductase (nitroreductase family)
MTVDDAVIRALAVGPDSSRDERTIEITTLGRRSGIPRRNEIWLHRVDGRWYLTGMPVPRSWYANLRANPRFMVHLKHGVTADLPANAVPVDEQTRRRVITAVLDLQNRPDVAARVGRRARPSTCGSRAARWSRSCSTTSNCGQHPRRGLNSSNLSNRSRRA